MIEHVRRLLSAAEEALKHGAPATASMTLSELADALRTLQGLSDAVRKISEAERHAFNRHMPDARNAFEDALRHLPPELRAGSSST